MWNGAEWGDISPEWVGNSGWEGCDYTPYERLVPKRELSFEGLFLSQMGDGGDKVFFPVDGFACVLVAVGGTEFLPFVQFGGGGSKEFAVLCRGSPFGGFLPVFSEPRVDGLGVIPISCRLVDSCDEVSGRSPYP